MIMIKRIIIKRMRTTKNNNTISSHLITKYHLSRKIIHYHKVDVDNNSCLLPK